MSSTMSLYMIQDNERPMWVIARDYNDALRLWESRVREENDMAKDEAVDPPQGIQHICEQGDLIWPREPWQNLPPGSDEG
jgi:hypothetical protein